MPLPVGESSLLLPQTLLLVFISYVNNDLGMGAKCVDAWPPLPEIDSTGLGPAQDTELFYEHQVMLMQVINDHNVSNGHH